MHETATVTDFAAGALSIPEACRFLGDISRAKLYVMFQTGELPFVKVGGRRVVLRSELAAYLARQAQAQGK